jgi:hypothetical protein
MNDNIDTEKKLRGFHIEKVKALAQRTPLAKVSAYAVA